MIAAATFIEQPPWAAPALCLYQPPGGTERLTNLSKVTLLVRKLCLIAYLFLHLSECLLFVSSTHPAIYPSNPLSLHLLNPFIEQNLYTWLDFGP